MIKDNAVLTTGHILDCLQFTEKILHRIDHDQLRTLPYHYSQHTWDVYREAHILGMMEKLSTEDTVILSNASLVHDLGFSIRYMYNEIFGVELAIKHMERSALPYSPSHVNSMISIGLESDPSLEPSIYLSKMHKDADLYSLGSPKFLDVSDQLRNEWFMHSDHPAHKFTYKDMDWLNFQKDFLKNHEFYSEMGEKRYNMQKKVNIERLDQLISDCKTGNYSPFLWK